MNEIAKTKFIDARIEAKNQAATAIEVKPVNIPGLWYSDSKQKKFLADLIANVKNTKRTQEQDDQAIARIRKWFQTDPN